MGFGLVTLHIKGALAAESFTLGFGYTWEGQSFQGQQGPKVSVHQTWKIKGCGVIHTSVSVKLPKDLKALRFYLSSLLRFHSILIFNGKKLVLLNLVTLSFFLNITEVCHSIRKYQPDL